MKKLLYIALGLMLFSTAACTDAEDTAIIEENSMLKDDYIIDENNYHKEFYGGNDQLKMEGAYDQNKERHGIWKYYNVDGKTISVTEYKHGLKHGYSIVYTATGALKYRGEYADDKQIGEWKFYNAETGQLDKTVDYGQPTK